MTKRVLIAPNAFKHSLSAIDVALTIKSTLESFKLNFNYELAPIADGGDGTIDVMNFYFKKSKFIKANVNDPLMREIQSEWLLLDDETAVIELAKASGISLLKQNELNPMWANTFGTGELILQALAKRCKKIVICLGGSATIDGGLGIVQALGGKMFDKKKQPVKAGGGFLSSVEKIDLSSLDKRIKDVKLNVLCDVKSTLIGKSGTINFSSQKGASEGEKVVLELGMKHFAEVIKKITNLDCDNEPMVGTAGGVAYGLKTLLNAELFLGFTYLSNMISLEDKVKSSDLVITGEGYLDSQTLMGKAVFELARLTNKHHKKVIVICGDYEKNINWSEHFVDTVIQIKPENMPVDESIKNTKNLIQSAIKREYEIFRNY